MQEQLADFQLNPTILDISISNFFLREGWAGSVCKAFAGQAWRPESRCPKSMYTNLGRDGHIAWEGGKDTHYPGFAGQSAPPISRL